MSAVARALAGLALVAGVVGSASGRPHVAPVDARADSHETPHETARRVLAVALEREGLPEGAVLEPRGEWTRPGGVTEMRWRQVVDGVPVLRGEHAAWLLPDGRPLAVRIGEVAAGSPGPFLLAAEQAVALAEIELGGSWPAEALRPGGAALLRADVRELEDGLLEVTLPGSAAAAALRVISAEGPHAAWRVELGERGDPEHRWCVIVDAVAGHVLARIDVTDHAATRGRVYPVGFLGGSVLRDFVDGEDTIADASPAGWMSADQTLGNNAYVWEDRAGDSTATTGAVATATGSPLSFDFPVSGVPLNDLDAALTNVFWAVNEAHDRFHRLGFDEPSGACQTSNFGRGGRGTDYTRVFVQYRAGVDATQVRNTSTASAGLDGSYNSMTFGLWNTSGELRDGAFDTGLVFHEYAHLVITRLAGGDSTCDDGTQPSGLAEGWADYFGASFTGDTVVGAWVSGNEQRGLRSWPIDECPYTYSNLCNVLGQYCNRNENGEIWAGALWDLRLEFQALMGPAAGAEHADRLVVEGLRYTPCRPTYVDARDGLLLADQALSGGAHRCLVASALAGRGIGASARSTGPDDAQPWAGYDLPPECTGGASVSWERPRYGDDADALVFLADATAAGGSRRVSATTSAGDAEQWDAAGAGLARSVVVPLRSSAAVSGNGVLEVADGDLVTACCEDCPGRPCDVATISRALAVGVNSYDLSSESCHDDDAEASVGDFASELPSVLDSGERVTLTVNLGNAETFPLEDVRVRVRCDDPDVLVLPTGEIPVGRAPARFAGPASMPLSLRAVALPSPATTFGDSFTLTFDVTARGLAGSASVTIPLAGDYLAERGVKAFGGVETFEPGSPSAASWTHAPAAGQPADAWAVRNCGDGGGRAMTYTGAACGDYDDTPSAATLVSPPLYDLSAQVQAVHPIALQWRNDVQLGRASPSLYCDSEMVLLYLTDTPSRPRYGDPIGDRNNATQYWAQWTGLGVERNTAGWETGTPRVALTTTSTNGMRLPDVRLYWVFFTDVYTPQNSFGCRPTEQAVGPGYKLDNVDFSYDRVRLVPPATDACVRTCNTRAFLTVSPLGGARCAGDPVALSGELSEAAGCPGGALEYRFTGPGLSTSYTSVPTATGVAGNGGTWTLTVRCAGDTACSDTMSLADPTLDDVDAGRTAPTSLRVRRDADDVVLSWEGTRAPVAYAVFRADVSMAGDRRGPLADLGLDPPPVSLRHSSPGALTQRDVGAARNGVALHAYRVTGREPCSGAALAH